MKKILVTGGAGYIGSHTVLALIDAGYQVVIVDDLRNSERFIISRLKKITGQDISFYEQDYKDVLALKRIVEKEKIEGVIHFAADKAVGESVAQPLKYYANNVSGFINLMKVVQESNISNIVLSSSAAVYGIPPTEKVSEKTACKPTSPYGWSKLMDETILESVVNASPNLNAIALRYFNVVGANPSSKIGELPKGKPQNLLPLIVDVASHKISNLTVLGDDYQTPDGTCLRDYVHVVDLAEAHVKALDLAISSTGGYRIYNIGTGKPTSVLELIKLFERLNGVNVNYEIGPRRAGDPPAYYAVVDKANKELRWQAKKTVSDACRDAWHWQQANSKG